MSILSALKARGAEGKNIEEAVKTLPIGGGSGDNYLWVHLTTTDPNGETYTADVSRTEIMEAMTNQTPVFATLLYVANGIITFGGTFGVGFISGQLVFYVEPSKSVYSLPQGDEYTWTLSMH